MRRAVVYCTCGVTGSCFPHINVPDVYSALSIVDRARCLMASYEVVDEYGIIFTRMHIINGMFKIDIGLGLYTSSMIPIGPEVAEMYLIWNWAVYVLSWACGAYYTEYIAKFIVTDSMIHFNGEQIKPYCTFKSDMMDIIVESESVNVRAFIALSAAMHGGHMLY